LHHHLILVASAPVLEILAEKGLTGGPPPAKVANSLRTFSDYLHPLIKEIEQKEDSVKAGANMATMQKITGTVGFSVFPVRPDEKQSNQRSSKTYKIWRANCFPAPPKISRGYVCNLITVVMVFESLVDSLGTVMLMNTRTSSELA